jgi:hypothetical protein
MTEQTLLPAPDSPPEAPVTAPNPPRHNLVPWFYGLGFLILAAAIFYVWQYPVSPTEPAGETLTLQSVEQRLAAFDGRLSRLADIDARLIRLEQRPTPDLGKIITRLDALDGRPTLDLGKIIARLDALDGRVADQTQLASRLDTLSGRIESLSGRDQTGIDATKQQIDALTTRISALESNAGNIEAVTKRLNRIARLQEASFALASGRPIGDLPDAPEALARYSHAAPPKEADLRLRFPHAEQAALAAYQPGEKNAPFIGRVWERAQGLITIRRGDEVVVGDPTAVILNSAQIALDAGDLAGAIAAVETLKGQPEQAMADWLAEARALADARSALAQMAAQA